MDTRQLQCFLTVADCLNFTKASAVLGVTHAAVSYQIAALEKDLGAQLFRRTRPCVKLTPAGRAFFYEARDLMQGYEQMAKRIKALDAGEQGEIAIGVLGVAERRFLPLALKHFKDSHPGIQVQIRRYDMLPLAQAIQGGAVDIGFTLSMGFLEQRGFRKQILFSEPLVIVMRYDHPLAAMPSLSLEDLREEPIAQLTPVIASPTKNAILDLFATIGAVPRVTYWAEDFDSLILRVESGMEVAMFPRYRAEAHLNGRLVCRPLAGEGMTVDYAAVWPDPSENPAIPHFLRTLGLSQDKDFRTPDTLAC